MLFKRLEIYKNKQWEWGKLPSFCGCIIVDLGPIGITWLADECYHGKWDDEGPEQK